MPEGHRAQFLPGFVEELVVSDDPEYKWIDKIRTPRASNEARQLLFNRLSGEVSLSKNIFPSYLGCSGAQKDRLEGPRVGRKCCNRVQAVL